MIINGVSYPIEIATKGSPNIQKKSVLHRTYIDGEVDSIDYGARIEHLAEFEISFLTKESFVTLVDYFIANAGVAVPFIYENPAEQLWVDVEGGSLGGGQYVYYAYVLEPNSLQEEDFSIDDTLYKLNLKIALGGTTSTAIDPNPLNTAKFDILIEVDTLGDNVTRSNTAPVSPDVGDRWLKYSDFSLSEWDGATWVFLYTVQANSPSHAWEEGTFRFSSFATDNQSIFSHIYWSGFINFESIKFPAQSIDISKGASVSRKEGFSFAISNNDSVDRTFWNYIVEKGINLFGSICTINFVHNGNVTQYSRGRNITNSFTYINYRFNVTPFALNSQKQIPDTTIEDVDGTRYADVKAGVIGKAPYLTYGTHEMASLQDITTEAEDVIVTRQYASPSDDIIQSNVFQGRIRAVSPIELDKVEYVSAGVADYRIEGSTFQITDVVEGDKVSVAGCTKENNNGEILTVIQRSGGVLRLSNPNVNSPSDDEFTSPGVLTFLTDKIYVNKARVVEPSGFISYDNYTLTPDQLSKLNLATSVITVTFDSQFALSTDNYDVIKKIVSIDSTTNLNYYIFSLDSLLPYPSTSLGTQPQPNTRDYIHFTVSSFAFQYQSGDIPHQSFGVYNDNGTPHDNTDFTYYEDQLKLFTLDDKNKALIPIPNTKFTINAYKNLVALNPEASADPSVVNTDAPIISAPPVIYNSSVLLPQTTTVKTQNGFDFQENSGLTSLLTLPASYLFYARSRVGRTSTAHPYLYTAIKSTSDRNFREGSTIDRDFMTQSVEDGETTYNHQIYWDSLSRETSKISQGSCALAYTFPINHTNDAQFVNSTAVKLALKFDITSVVRAWKNGGIPDEDRDTYTSSMPFILHIRFRKKDGTYEYDASEWKYSFNQNNMGVIHLGVDNLGNCGFDNVPSPIKNNFEEGRNILDGTGIDYVGNLRTYSPNTNEDRWEGEIFGFNTLPGWRIYKGSPTGSTIVLDSGVEGEKDGLLFWNGDRKLGNTVTSVRDVQIVKNNNLETAVAGADFTTNPRMDGRDLVNLTGNIDLFGGSGKWEACEAMEIVIEPDFDNMPLQWGDEYPNPSQAQWDFTVKFDNETPLLYIASTQDVVDKPLFSAVKGKVIGSVYTESAKEITKDILNIIYPNKYNVASVDNYFTGARANWKFRRQFTSAMSASQALQELLENLWAVAVINDNDEFEIHPLDTTRVSSATSIQLTDSSIIQDSISEIRYRKADSIYQKFKLGYDYYIPSEFSEALWEYGEQVTVSETEGDTKLKQLINNTGILYNLQNFYEKNFKYHYEDLPIAEAVVRWLAFNSWSFKVEVAIERILAPNQARLMSPVTITSYFHSKDETFKGYITSIKPNVYKGTATLGIYIPEPAGALGSLCDPFNDALNVTNRDTTGWTNENGQLNDAGKISTRTLGSTTHKDAGQVSTRTFECS